MTVAEIIRAIFGGIFILLVPGLAWSYVFFPRKDINWLERIALSFGLSIALVALAVFLVNKLFGVGINLVTFILVTISLTALASALAFLRRKGNF